VVESARVIRRQGVRGIREQPADFHPVRPDPFDDAAVLAALPRREKGDAISFNLPYLRYVRKDERRPIL
jgi:hypothetical protein